MHEQRSCSAFLQNARSAFKNSSFNFWNNASNFFPIFAFYCLCIIYFVKIKSFVTCILENLCSSSEVKNELIFCDNAPLFLCSYIIITVKIFLQKFMNDTFLTSYCRIKIRYCQLYIYI